MWRLSRTQKLLRCKLLCSSSLLLHRKGDKDHCSYWDYKKKQTKLKVSAGINDFRSTRACFCFPLIEIKGASSLTGMMYSLFWGVVGWSWRKTLELSFSILHSFLWYKTNLYLRYLTAESSSTLPRISQPWSLEKRMLVLVMFPGFSKIPILSEWLW